MPIAQNLQPIRNFDDSNDLLVVSPLAIFVGVYKDLHPALPVAIDIPEADGLLFKNGFFSCGRNGSKNGLGGTAISLTANEFHKRGDSNQA